MFTVCLCYSYLLFTWIMNLLTLQDSTLKLILNVFVYLTCAQLSRVSFYGFWLFPLLLDMLKGNSVCLACLQPILPCHSCAMWKKNEDAKVTQESASLASHQMFNHNYCYNYKLIVISEIGTTLRKMSEQLAGDYVSDFFLFSFAFLTPFDAHTPHHTPTNKK